MTVTAYTIPDNWHPINCTPKPNGTISDVCHKGMLDGINGERLSKMEIRRAVVPPLNIRHAYSKFLEEICCQCWQFSKLWNVFRKMACIILAVTRSEFYRTQPRDNPQHRGFRTLENDFIGIARNHVFGRETNNPPPAGEASI